MDNAIPKGELPDKTSQPKKMSRGSAYTEDELDKFLLASKASGDACHARMLEAKRSLDHLLRDLKSLAAQINSHEEVLLQRES